MGKTKYVSWFSESRYHIKRKIGAPSLWALRYRYATYVCFLMPSLKLFCISDFLDEDNIGHHSIYWLKSETMGLEIPKWSFCYGNNTTNRIERYQRTLKQMLLVKHKLRIITDIRSDDAITLRVLLILECQNRPNEFQPYDMFPVSPLRVTSLQVKFFIFPPVYVDNFRYFPIFQRFESIELNQFFTA